MNHLEQAAQHVAEHLKATNSGFTINPAMIQAILQALLIIVQAFNPPTPTPAPAPTPAS